MISDILCGSIAPVVIGFGGSALSGKSRLSEKVAIALSWPRASFGDYVRHLAFKRGLGLDRATLQTLGKELVESDLESFCRAVLTAANWLPGQPAILDGIRHLSALTTLRAIVAPQRLVLVVVTASESVRRTRLDVRQSTANALQDAVSIDCIDQHSTEKDAVSELPSIADIVLDSSEGLEQTNDVLRWLASLESHR